MVPTVFANVEIVSANGSLMRDLKIQDIVRFSKKFINSFNLTSHQKEANMVTVKQAEKMLEDVPHGRQFIIHNGASVKNLKELGEAVSLMPDNSFHYHVSNDRNDIAEWLRDT